MAMNPAAAYGNNKIATATPAELTLMLYDGAIKFCNLAIMAIEQEEYGKASINIQKARKIIVELKSTLNFDYEVAKDFDVVYEYLFHKMIEANKTKDPAVLEEILVQLRDIRDVWKQIMKQAKDPRI